MNKDDGMSDPWKCTCSKELRTIGYHSGDCPWFLKNQEDGPQLVSIELSQSDALALLKLLETSRKVWIPNLPDVIGELRAVLNLTEEPIHGSKVCEECREQYESGRGVSEDDTFRLPLPERFCSVACAEEYEDAVRRSDRAELRGERVARDRQGSGE